MAALKLWRIIAGVVGMHVSEHAPGQRLAEDMLGMDKLLHRLFLESAVRFQSDSLLKSWKHSRTSVMRQ